MRGLTLLALWLAATAAQARPLGALGGLALAPCRLSAPQMAGSIEAECTRMALPENPADPKSRTISVRVAVLASRATHPEPDPVVFLAGGPGQSAIEAYPSAQPALNALLSRRHILLVEQRGTGESNPLKCPLPDWKEDQGFTPAASREQALACLKAIGNRADTRYYTTGDYIADLERVRTAAGISTVNLAGGSYGTRVALEYLRRHPGAIRSVFIDSVVPPELALGQDHARNLDDAVAALAARCAADKDCAARFGDVGTGLKRLKDEAQRAPRIVTMRHPRTGAEMHAPFNVPALVGVARLFLYAPDSASLLPLLLGEAAHRNPEPLLAQAELIYTSVPDQLAHGLELSVTCAEDSDLLHRDPANAATLIGEDFITVSQAQCAVWPHGTRPPDFKQPVVSDKPVLLLSGQYDPVTPPRYAEHVAQTLSNSRALVAKGQGHTPMGVGCLPRLLRQFVEALDPKSLDARCLDALGDTPFFLDAQGPNP